MEALLRQEEGIAFIRSLGITSREKYLLIYYLLIYLFVVFL